MVLTGNVANFATAIINTPSHVLIGGATGAGKSTVIDLLIHSMLLSPNTPALMLIDPKRIDLFKYKKMRCTIAYTDNERGALELLNNAVRLMESRYQTMQRKNTRVCNERRVYIVIDELADLVLIDKKVFIPLQRLLQKGRASNIFVICATQICNVQVLPTLLRGNITTIIALHCETANISRLLLGRAGAEMLPLHGRALIKTPAGIDNINIPLFTDTEINAAIDFWRR